MIQILTQTPLRRAIRLSEVGHYHERGQARRSATEWKKQKLNSFGHTIHSNHIVSATVNHSTPLSAPQEGCVCVCVRACTCQVGLYLTSHNSSPSVPWQRFFSTTDISKSSKVTGFLLSLWIWMDRKRASDLRFHTHKCCISEGDAPLIIPSFRSDRELLTLLYTI